MSFADHEDYKPELATDERIDRLENVLGTLISWLTRELGQESQKQLLDILNLKGTEEK